MKCAECGHHLCVRKSEYYTTHPEYPVTGEPTLEGYSLYAECSNCSTPVPTITLQALFSELNPDSAVTPKDILDKIRAKESSEGPFTCRECHRPLYVIRSLYCTPDPVTHTLVLEDTEYFVECPSQELHVPTDHQVTAIIDLVKTKTEENNTMPFTFEVEFTSLTAAYKFTHWLANTTDADWVGTVKDDYIHIVCKNLTFKELRMCGDQEKQLKEGDKLNAIQNSSANY